MRALVLLTIVLLFATASSAAAQDDPVQQFIDENVAMGAGCNPIALAVEGLSPVAPDQAWQDDHTACVGPTFQAMAQCDDVAEGEPRTIVCALLVLQGDGAFAPGCLNYQLITSLGPFGADPELTNQAVALMKEGVGSRGMEAGAELFISCAESPPLATGAIVVSAFGVTGTSGELVFQAKAGDGQGNMSAFIVMATSS